MPLKQKKRNRNRNNLIKWILEDVSYRVMRPVVHVRRLQNGDCYPICPRCNRTIEREYMRFCDRCGQPLDWKLFVLAVIKK